MGGTCTRHRDSQLNEPVHQRAEFLTQLAAVAVQGRQWPTHLYESELGSE